MSTRCLTIVKVGGRVKVCQYCPWDGYPAGVGADIAKFIHKDLDMRKFKTQLKKVRFTKNIDSLDKSGPDILKLIQDGKVTALENASAENHYVEYIYEIDLNKKTVEVTFCGLDQPIVKKYAFKNFTRQAMTGKILRL